MNAENNTHRSKPSDPEWSLLTECPISELMREIRIPPEHGEGWLARTTIDLGIKPDLLDSIERELIWFTTQVSGQLDQVDTPSSTNVRVFCQKDTLEYLHAVKASSPGEADQAISSTRSRQSPTPEITGGWGYFLVERDRRALAGNSRDQRNWVDLYLYKEG